MAKRAVAFLWGSVLLAAALLGAAASWSRALPACDEVPAAQRERERLAGRCEARAPIVNVAPNARGAVASTRRAVPDLRGRPFNHDDARLARYVVAIDYRESAKRRDWVIDQVPRPPALLPDGGNLRVVLSDGTLVRVPDVRGNFARALVRLYRAGLAWSTGDGPAGRVVGQVPAPGAAVKPGTQIALRLAPGPVALAPESTRPQVAPPTAPGAPPSSTVPAAPPGGATSPSATRLPPTTAPAAGSAPATFTMPDVEGLIFDVARERLSGFSVQRVHRGGTEPGGTVIGQTPAAGAPVAPGATVRLVLSDGSLVRVPRVMSFTISEAKQRLSAGELQPVITNVASDSPAGTVVSQQPAEGQIAKRGTSIRLNVSTGPAKAAAPVTVAVPDLVGSSFERARPQLERFKVDRSERAAREPVGTILEQSPAAGTAVEPGSPVSIIVSSGGRPEVIELANVVGQSADAATAALSEFRLEREAVPSVEPAGRVLAQEPAAGATVAPGGTVRLRVSDGSRVNAPTVVNMTLVQARDVARAAGLGIALSEETDDAAALVRRQEPAAGTEVARGSTLQLAVEDRSLPFDVNLPPAARDAWMRVTAYAAQWSPRTLAIAGVVLLALLALLLVSRRRARAPYAPVEPVLASAEPPVADQASARAAPVAPPAPPPGAAITPTMPPVPQKPVLASGEPPVTEQPQTMATPVTRPAPSPVAATTPAMPLAPQEPVLASGEPPVAEQPPTMATPVPRPAPSPVAATTPTVPLAPQNPKDETPQPAPPPIATAPAPAPEPDPVVFGAVARLESDPAAAVASAATPRGPEIRVSARMETTEGSVFELPAEPMPEALTEETK